MKRAKSRLELGGEAAGGQPEIERGIDQVLHVVGVEDSARDRHRRHAGHERLAARNAAS